MRPERLCQLESVRGGVVTTQFSDRQQGRGRGAQGVLLISSRMYISEMETSNCTFSCDVFVERNGNDPLQQSMNFHQMFP
jgi:hypothetical protein